jgi:hypothetical protein
MRSRHFIALIIGLIAPATLAAAQIAPPPERAPKTLIPLEGDDLKRAYSGHVVEGIYKTSRQRTGTNIFTERFHKDGTTEYREGHITDKGQWAVRGKLICFGYEGELSGGISCYNVYKSGSCLYAYNPAAIGTDGYPVNDNLWSAKTINRGDVSSCGDLIS